MIGPPQLASGHMNPEVVTGDPPWFYASGGYTDLAIGGHFRKYDNYCDPSQYNQDLHALSFTAL
jgi:hypothetical protein